MKNFQVVKKIHIYRQQDNVKPHLMMDDPNILGEYLKNGSNMKKQCQPPNSLNLNVLNLGLFNAIQSL